MKLKIIIQGFGQFAKMLKYRCDNIFEIIAFIDRSKNVTRNVSEFEGIPVYNDLMILSGIEFDYIFITAEDYCGVAKEYNQRFNILYEKIISMKHTHQLDKQMSLCAAANEIYHNDIQGAVAELGVDNGDTSKFLNLFFSDRKLYLFDTFEGFAQQDIESERELGTMVEHLTTAFDERSNEELVMNKMYYKERVIIKKGYFPDSLNGLEEKFAFVHIDCDLTKPILAGLEYFYPRTVSGGMIFVHDFYNTNFPGVREVVRKFANEMGNYGDKIRPYVPNLMYGGVVFTKG